MQLRWVVLIALWTLFSGPVFAPVPVPAAPRAPKAGPTKMVGGHPKANAGR